MAGTPRDRELEEAQQEIQRRLLRQEKLKRIEEEEMRRLAATGWRPPIERMRSGGPTTQDAADAIEVTEQKRRAYAREASKRVEAQAQSEEASDQPEVHGSNRIEVGWGESVDISQWQPAGTASSARPTLEFEDGDRIAVVASSIAFPPTNQFAWSARALPLADDGTPLNVMAPPDQFEAVPYSSGPTGWSARTFVLRATLSAPKYRWTVTLDSQQAAHGAATANLLRVFVP